MKLIVTYAESVMSIFTEDRGKPVQRALIDIGGMIPTPEQLAETASVLADQWGWMNPIVKSNGRPVDALPKAKTGGRPQGGYHADELPGPERKKLIIAYLAEHPQSTVRRIVEGCGFEPTALRVGRWGAMLKEMERKRTLVMRMTETDGPQGVREYQSYSLAPKLSDEDNSSG